MYLWFKWIMERCYPHLRWYLLYLESAWAGSSRGDSHPSSLGTRRNWSDHHRSCGNSIYDQHIKDCGHLACQLPLSSRRHRQLNNPARASSQVASLQLGCNLGGRLWYRVPGLEGNSDSWQVESLSLIMCLFHCPCSNRQGCHQYLSITDSFAQNGGRLNIFR